MAVGLIRDHQRSSYRLRPHHRDHCCDPENPPEKKKGQNPEKADNQEPYR